MSLIKEQNEEGIETYIYTDTHAQIDTHMGRYRLVKVHLMVV